MDSPKVGIIMGSQSDWPTMKGAAEILDELGVAYETKIVSAHRTPDRLWEYGQTAMTRRPSAIIVRARVAGPPPALLRPKTPAAVLGVAVTAGGGPGGVALAARVGRSGSGPPAPRPLRPGPLPRSRR